jgi:ADP-L-glycero-D-manno-heptose 6-epimerase
MKPKIDIDQLIVITGAAGLIGSGVVRYLNDLGYFNLLLVDDLDHTDKWKNLLGKKFSRLIGVKELFSFLEGKEREISSFIHLGACSDTLETNGAYLMENNYSYSIRLAEYALKHEKRFIYASSAATYGDGKNGFSDDHRLLQSLKPLNLYGFSKQLFDLWALEQGVLDRLVGLKYFNVFGPNENHKGRMASMVYKMVPLIQKEGVLKLFKSNEPDKFKDGDQSRDFIYVKDAARITCAFLGNEISGIFNVGSGIASTWNQLAKAVFSAMNLPISIDYIPLPEELGRQYQNYTCAEMDLLKRAFGQENLCIYSLENAVSDYVKEYLLKGERW